MKKFLLCLISVAFVACNKDIDEQNELLSSGSEVSANASISLQKEIENQNSPLIESFLKKEQLFAQEVQTLRGRKTFTEEIAREKLMPLVKESVYLLNFFGMSNEEIVQNFGSLNDPRIALAGTLITTLEKEKNKGGDISESKFWDCAQEVVGLKVTNEERHEKFKEIAHKNVLSFLERVNKRVELDHHDLGFLYTPSCMSEYKLDGDKNAKEAALKAADKLIERYQGKGGFIQAWGELGKKEHYRLIIDCLLNIQLLFFAYQETGEQKYYEIAEKHFYASVNNVIRDDASSFHTFYFDPETGHPLKGVTRQGYSDDSCWARGQSWGVYGIPLTYRHLKDESCFDLFKGVTNYFLNRLPKDHVSYWDLIFSDGSEQSRDSSATAIAVCGIHDPNRCIMAS